MGMIVRLLALFCLLVGCATPPTLPPSPADVAAKRFEAAPGKSVIYLVRAYPDYSGDGTAILLDGTMVGTSYPGTYFRWEITSGAHRIAGFAGDSGGIDLDVRPGALYFVQQTLRQFHVTSGSSFRLVDAAHGQALVTRTVLVSFP
jgi:hypothetical protein